MRACFITAAIVAFTLANTADAQQSTSPKTAPPAKKTTGTVSKRPPAPPQDMLASPENPGWSVDERTGCWLWNGSPKPDEKVVWSGSCGSDGRATGSGVAEWSHDGKTT